MSSASENESAVAAATATKAGGSLDDNINGTADLRPLLASAKRPLMTHSKDGKLLSEKKLRRLEKNRLSARECRRRKREATENLERQINLLEGENLKLRLQLQIGEEAEDKTRQEQEKLTDGIVALLKNGASESDVYENIEKFKEKFADYGRDRRSAIEFHLRNIERLLMPTQTTVIVKRALEGHSQQQEQEQEKQDQKPAGLPTPDVSVPFDSPATSTAESVATASESVKASSDSALPVADPPQSGDPKILFQYLVGYLDVSPEQAADLKDSRFVAQELDSHLEKALKVLDELKTRLTQCGDDLESEFDKVRSILTPTQAAKFLIWVANNGACMHMLNELWGRAYPHSPNDPLESPSNDSP